MSFFSSKKEENYRILAQKVNFEFRVIYNFFDRLITIIKKEIENKIDIFFLLFNLP